VAVGGAFERVSELVEGVGGRLVLLTYIKTAPTHYYSLPSLTLSTLLFHRHSLTPIRPVVSSTCTIAAAAAAAAAATAATYLMKSQKYTALIQWTRVILSASAVRVHYILVLNYIIRYIYIYRHNIKLKYRYYIIFVSACECIYVGFLSGLLSTSVFMFLKSST